MTKVLKRFSLKYVFLYVAISAIACWLVVSFYPLGALYASLFVVVCFGGMAVWTRRDSLALLCGLLFLIIGLLGFPMVTMSAHPVPIHRLNRIGRGATAAEVESLIGKPSRIDSTTSGESWVYAGCTWCYITIQFTPDATVDSVVHDH